jgi:mannose-6-phosphate isomerase
VLKPWGSTDLRPWGGISGDGNAVGELWFERAGGGAAECSLLLKLLFTTQPLSIQVHPDDEFARSIGLAQGKTEAWYVLSATPDARVAVGLQWQLTKSQFRRAIEDGSIAGLVQWRRVQRDDVILVPAGTIHAIGPGLVIAEIQQRSDATFRIFDYGRKRELHVENAVAAATPGPATWPPVPTKLTDARSLLVVDSHFVLERFDLPPHSSWSFDAECETWLFAMRGSAQIESLDLSPSGVMFVDDEQARIDVGPDGLKALAAYRGAEVKPDLLRKLDASRDAPASGPSAQPEQSPPSAASQGIGTETLQ